MVKVKEIKISLKEYNNKGRKGLYISIKAKGKPLRLYKYTGTNTEIDATKKYYEDRYIKNKPLAKSQQTYKKTYEQAYTKEKPKQKQRLKIYRQANQYISKIRKQRTLNQIIKSGIAKVTLENVHKKGNYEMKEAIKKLLYQVVLDPQLVEILTQEQNLEKIKHRFEYTLNIKNDKQETVLIMNKFNITPQRVLNEIKQSIEEGEDISHAGSKSTTARKLKTYNWKILNQYEKEGKLNSTTLLMTFRK